MKSSHLYYERFKHRKALIVFNYGYGNVIMLLPILSALEHERSELLYTCIDHYLLHNNNILTEAGVSNIEGFVKPSWRRFLPEDVSDIFNYLLDNDIKWLINLRLEAPDHDKNYFLFKKEAICRGILCWDLHEFGLSSEISKVSEKIQKMFLLNGLPIDNVNFKWIRNRSLLQEKETDGYFTLAVYTGASRPSKRWSIDNWTKLIRQILTESKTKLLLFAGVANEEKQYAGNILNNIRPDLKNDFEYIVDQPLETVFDYLSTAKLIITQDTFVAHFAAASGIATIALYPATDSRIWQPMADGPFVAVQSHEALNCSEMKIDGTCKRYYSVCDKECCLGIKWLDVMEQVRKFLNGKTML